MMREPQNHIKHADRDGDEDKILRYRPATIGFYLYLGASGYADYTRASTPEMRVFIFWFGAINPHLLIDTEDQANVQKLVNTYGKFADTDKLLMLKLIQRLKKEST